MGGGEAGNGMADEDDKCESQQSAQRAKRRARCNSTQGGADREGMSEAMMMGKKKRKKKGDEQWIELSRSGS